MSLAQLFGRWFQLPDRRWALLRTLSGHVVARIQDSVIATKFGFWGTVQCTGKGMDEIISVHDHQQMLVGWVQQGILHDRTGTVVGAVLDNGTVVYADTPLYTVRPNDGDSWLAGAAALLLTESDAAQVHADTFSTKQTPGS